MAGITQVLARLPILIPRALAGDPGAIAALTAAGLIAVVAAVKKK